MNLSVRLVVFWLAINEIYLQQRVAQHSPSLGILFIVARGESCGDCGSCGHKQISKQIVCVFVLRLMTMILLQFAEYKRQCMCRW